MRKKSHRGIENDIAHLEYLLKKWILRTVQVGDQSIGVVAIDAERGPTDQVTYVASERELVEIFGKPNNNNYESWFAAATLIQYGAVVAVIRPTALQILVLTTLTSN